MSRRSGRIANIELKTLQVFFHCDAFRGFVTRGGHGSGVPESTPAGFYVFLSDPDPESKFRENPDPESLFNFNSSRSLHGHFLSKHKGKFRLYRW